MFIRSLETNSNKTQNNFKQREREKCNNKTPQFIRFKKIIHIHGMV